jgi:hypothetical protein
MSGTEPGGTCGVTDTCLQDTCTGAGLCLGCAYSNTGYSSLGDTGWYWTSSLVDAGPGMAGSNYWFVNFGMGAVTAGGAALTRVRCVLP